MSADFGEAIDIRSLFRTERSALLQLLSDTPAGNWTRPTACPGWSVHDVALHLLWGDLSNLSRRRDDWFGLPEEAPADPLLLSALIKFLNKLNNDWVDGARRISPPLVISLLEETGRQWVDFVDALDLEEMGGPVNWAGDEPAPVWFDIAREYTERWVHQQHIRDAVRRPGLVDHKHFHPVLDTFARALPYALRDCPAHLGATARLAIDGEAGGRWEVRREQYGWRFTAASQGVPTGALTLDQDSAWKLFTHGLSPDEARASSRAEGDECIVIAMLQMVTVLA
jgi:uncharacterized protein (TIGR03083 family)